MVSKYLPRSHNSVLLAWKDRLLGFINSYILGSICRIFKKIFRIRCFRFFYISTALSSWIESFDPDLIYTHLGEISHTLLFEQIRLAYKKPYAVHIMDDWFQFHPECKQDGPMYPMVCNQIQKASVLMAICDGMATEFKKRFGREFLAFHNPVDVESRKHLVKSDWSIKNESFTILFAGSLKNKLQDYAEVCKAIDDLRRKRDYRISFHLYTMDHDSTEARRLEEFQGVKVFAHIPNDQIAAMLVEADLLLLNLSLDENQARIAMFSMPTKTSEYMYSGTPILVYAHADSALTLYAQEYNWGFVVTERDSEKLKKAIADLYKNESLRQSLGETSHSLAVTRHNKVQVSQDFCEQLNRPFRRL